MICSTKVLSQTVTQLCLSKQIDHIVISPGSRNAPLTIGFTEDPSFKNFSIVDERCAAFFALGLAQQLHKPVALVCTSGSALLNYYPAVAEAYYSDIPLIIISADRPSNLVEIGDGQTIKQEGVFSNHILYSANCKEGEQEFNELQINKALNHAWEARGPVHINVPFSEPLYETQDTPSVLATSVPFTSRKMTLDRTSEAYKEFLNQWNQAKRKMILVGVLAPGSIEQLFINKLAEDRGVIILTETTSNLHHELLFPAIDQLIAPLDKEGLLNLQPDILLTFGGLVVSKKIKAFLRTHAPKNHYHVDAKKAYDTFFKLTHHFKVYPNHFLEVLSSDYKSIKSTYRDYWSKVREHRVSKHKAYVKAIPFCDFKVFYKVFKELPNNIQLQLANSATVRYAQLFNLHETYHVYCNRGTSGIDGSTSTAIGSAFASSRPTVFITGDLSFFYDSNALWNNYIPLSFRLIIINNSGGGIFRILPGEKNTDNFTRYFETKHHLTADKLAEMHGFQYSKANSEESLEKALKSFFKTSDAPKILEVFTPSKLNDEILLKYFKYIT